MRSSPLSRNIESPICALYGHDGIVCLDSDGKPQFHDLLFRSGESRLMAFDLLWDECAPSNDAEEMRRFRNGEDTRYLPLIDRKQRFVIPRFSSSGQRIHIH